MTQTKYVLMHYGFSYSTTPTKSNFLININKKNDRIFKFKTNREMKLVYVNSETKKSIKKAYLFHKSLLSPVYQTDLSATEYSKYITTNFIDV